MLLLEISVTFHVNPGQHAFTANQKMMLKALLSRAEQLMSLAPKRQSMTDGDVHFKEYI